MGDDLQDREHRFLVALLEQLTVEMDGVERSQVLTILQDSLKDGVRLYDRDIEEAAGEAGVDDPGPILEGLEEKGIIERWTETSSLSQMGVDEGIDEDKRIEKRMLSVDEEVLDRLFEEL